MNLSHILQSLHGAKVARLALYLWRVGIIRLKVLFDLCGVFKQLISVKLA